MANTAVKQYSNGTLSIGGQFDEVSLNGAGILPFKQVRILAVGGGGAGFGAGAGAGGMIDNTYTLTNSSYNIVVGQGGANTGTNNGGNTTITGVINGSSNTMVAIGGGYGGGAGGAGGSGGGGTTSSGGLGNSSGAAQQPTSTWGGYGFAGGRGGGQCKAAGGGGGAGGAGQNCPCRFQTFPSGGGAGRASNITGACVIYAGGGNTSIGTTSLPNLSWGGGGSKNGSGNSGIVVISYAGAQTASGGTVSSFSNSSGTFTVHTFTANGTFVQNTPAQKIYSNGTLAISSQFDEISLANSVNSVPIYQYRVLAVAGGGGSETATNSKVGGGGAGGMIDSVYKLNNNSSYNIVIGQGGFGVQNGGNTTITGTICGSSNTMVAIGGGYGANPPAAGGSGGGGSGAVAYCGGAAQQPTSTWGGFGFAGGAVGTSLCQYGGGGGGAGGAGVSRKCRFLTNNTAGAGRASNITGTCVTYASGGYGRYISFAGTTAAQTATTWGGGGAGGKGACQCGAGNSGIVVISYPGAQTASGGTVTSFSNTCGTFTVHTFTSNDTFTTGVVYPAQKLYSNGTLAVGGQFDEIGGSPIITRLLAVGGGGSGGVGRSGCTRGLGGDGGSGGVFTNNNVSLLPNSSYSIVVGVGGSSGSGSNSSFSGPAIICTPVFLISNVTITAIGGGKGGAYSSAGSSGGSGGGGGWTCYFGCRTPQAGGAALQPSQTFGGTLSNFGNAGLNGNSVNNGAGGKANTVSNITGANVTYGGVRSTYGGGGCGGAGSGTSCVTPTPPTSGNGGVVIISYSGAQTASGGVVTSYCTRGALTTVHTFTTNGTFTT